MGLLGLLIITALAAAPWDEAPEASNARLGPDRSTGPDAASAAGGTAAVGETNPTVGEEAEPPESAVAVSRPSMSWDVLGGGIPEAGVIATARVGFSRLGEIRIEVPILEPLLVGAWIGLDLGYWTPHRAGEDFGLVFGATARYRILHDAEWSIGVSASPGGRARFGSGGGGELVVPLTARALYAVDPRFLLGAAVDVPIRLAFPGRGDVFLALPITVGLAAEAHLLPSLAVTAVAGLGPALDTRGVEVAFRGVIGLGYRL